MADYQLAQLDAVAWLNTLPAESVDLAITDIAYESLEKWRAIGTTTRLKKEWFDIFPNNRIPELLAALYRVLKNNTHLYLYSDVETMFVFKPALEQAGFKFWKFLVWDKCLGPDTPVWTDRGVVNISAIRPGWQVATPLGFTPVLATRTTRAKSLTVTLSDKTEIVASLEHKFILQDNREIQADALRVGDVIKSCEVKDSEENCITEIDVKTIIPPDRLVYELPPANLCLWCGMEFDDYRAASAHQGRFCQKAISKEKMAERLGITRKKVMWWFGKRLIPAAWVELLGLEEKITGRVRAMMQQNSSMLFPEKIKLDYALGKFVGLYAAQGSKAESGVSFSFHSEKKDSHNFVARYVRQFGMHSKSWKTSDLGASVAVYFDFARWLIELFVCGNRSYNKYFKQIVFAAPDAFREGIFDGINDGDGSFEMKYQRDRFCSTSLDLAMFVLRHARERGWSAGIRRVENEHRGCWYVDFDRSIKHQGLTVVNISPVGERDLVDLAIGSPHQFLLANGGVSHNCKIGMGYHYRSQYELILFAEKGKRKLNNFSQADVIRVPRVNNGYPTEKPVEVSSVLIEQSSVPGQVVVDPFCGSGSVGVAALKLGRNFWGNDLATGAVDLARRRMVEIQTNTSSK